MLYELFLAGTIWFYLAFGLVPSILILSALANNAPGWSFFILLLTGVASAALSDFNVFTWILAHPVEVAAGVVAYLAIGVLWSRFKWSKLLDVAVVEYQKVREQLLPGFLQSAGIQEIKTEQQKQAFRQIITQRHGVVVPQASRHKSTIISWMAFWPLSFFWTVAADYVLNIFERIFNAIQNMYHRMVMRKFGKFAEFQD